jgi:hypothetical protein
MKIPLNGLLGKAGGFEIKADGLKYRILNCQLPRRRLALNN